MIVDSEQRLDLIRNHPELENLEKKISAARNHSSEKARKQNSNYSYSGTTPVRVIIELFAGIAVGLGIGYFVDSFFDTKPLFFIIFMFLGVAGSVLNIYKLAEHHKEDDKDIDDGGRSDKNSSK